MAITTVYDSAATWQNGFGRFLAIEAHTDYFDPRLSIWGGSGGRQLYIDGKGNGFLSGDQARLRIKSDIFESQIELSVLWNSSLTSLDLRFRDRHNYAAPDSNRFGGYAIVINQNGSIEAFRENYHDNYTDMTGSPHTITALTTGEWYSFKGRVYNNVADTEVLIEFDIDRDDLGYKQEYVWTDTAPSAYMMDSALYHADSYNYVRINGTSVKDVQLRDLRIQDLKNYNVIGYIGEE